MKTLSEDLLKWWKINQRQFPWRVERDSYKLLIAEILLHRTRAESVAPVYLQFVKKFPTIEKLSESDPREVKRALHTLGLRWRVKALLEAAAIIQRDLSGTIPMDKELLLTLPGIGDYIASAIRVFSGGFDDPLIDTNTVRIASRIYKIRVNDSTRKGVNIRSLYNLLRNGTEAAKFGFALIDLGATTCLSIGPLCRTCPIAKYCKTGQGNTKIRI